MYFHVFPLLVRDTYPVYTRDFGHIWVHAISSVFVCYLVLPSQSIKFELLLYFKLFCRYQLHVIFICDMLKQFGTTNWSLSVYNIKLGFEHYWWILTFYNPIFSYALVIPCISDREDENRSFRLWNDMDDIDCISTQYL